MDVLQEPSFRTAQLPRVRKISEPPHQRGRTKQPATTVTPKPAPRQRVIRQSMITMTPGRAKMQPPYTEPQAIPDDTEVLAPLPHPYDGSKYNIPIVHIYNTRDRKIKVHNLMANHVAKILPLRQPATSLL